MSRAINDAKEDGMAVYRVKMKGRATPVLLRAKSKTEAIDAVVVEAKALTGEEVEEALASGTKLWNPADELPADETPAAPPPPPADED
jgi:hypothetical protein